jgi:hypothetical protein
MLVADHFAVGENDPPLRLGGEGCVMRDEYEGDVITQVELLHQVKDMLAVLRVEIACRFVRQ